MDAGQKLESDIPDRDKQMAEARQILADRDRRVCEDEMGRLVLLVIGAGEEDGTRQRSGSSLAGQRWH